MNRSRHRSKRAVLLLSLALLTLNHASAEQYFFVGTNFPQILEQSERGQINGLGADIARTIVSRLGHQLDIKLFPFKRALKLIESGQADAIIGPYKSEAREKYMIYSEDPFYEDSLVFYSDKHTTFEWDGQLASLSGKSIGLTRGWSYGTEFDQFKKKLNTFDVDSVYSGFKMLELDRFELFASHPRAANGAIDKLKISNNVKVILPPIIVNRGYFGFSKAKHLENFVTQFNAKFNEMKESGEIRLLNKKYKLSYTDA